ncbi:uncharacterized protein [Antedon mediterranea]|uniref:uncharacterized protein n=1 Tax=Antedon mediterranea TaxID=105859 RepID=UPI003AF4C13C
MTQEYFSKCQEAFSFFQSHDDISSPDGIDNLYSKINQDWQTTQSYDVRSQVCANLNLKSTDPQTWDIDDVQVWLRWVSTTCLKMDQSDIPPVCMDGRSLSSCTEDNFREMLQVSPMVAANIYQIFKSWYQDDVQTIKAMTSGGGLWDSLYVQEPVISTTMNYEPPMETFQPDYHEPQFEQQQHHQHQVNVAHSSVDCEAWQTPVSPSGYFFNSAHAPYDRPLDFGRPPPEFGRPPPVCHYYPISASCPSSMSGCQTSPCDTVMVPHQELDKQPKKRRGPGRPKLIRPPKTKKLQLFEFLLEYLENPCSPHLEWIDKSTGLFRFQSAHKEDFANKWGDYKGNRNMTYQNLARALRNYCHSNIKIMLNEKRKLHYRFNIEAILEHPTKFKCIFRSYAKHTTRKS